MTALTTLTAWFALGLAGVAPSQAQTYSITALPALRSNGIQPSDNNEAEGWRLNNLGQAVGQSDFWDSSVYWGFPSNTATLWSNGKAISVGTLGLRSGPQPCNANSCYDTSRAYALNNSGEVVGYESAYVSSGAPDHAFLWSNGKMTDISNDALFPYGTWAVAINASGQIVGRGSLGITDHAFLYANGVMVDIGTLPGGNYAVATDINDAGQVVGISNGQGFLYSNGQMTQLPIPANAPHPEPQRINANGEIIASLTVGGASHIGLFSNGQWTDLGGVAGASFVFPTGINRSGEIVGWASFPGNYSVKPHILPHSVGMIRLNGAWVDLNTLIPANSGFHIDTAYDINDAGQILCNATSGSVFWSHVLLLSPK